MTQTTSSDDISILLEQENVIKITQKNFPETANKEERRSTKIAFLSLRYLFHGLNFTNV